MKNIINIMDLYENSANALLAGRHLSNMYSKKYPFSYYQKNKTSGMEWVFSLPGYGDENIVCSVTNNILKLELSELEDQFTNCKGCYQFQLPDDVDSESLTASITNGILVVTAENTKQKEKKIKINKNK